MRTIQILSEEHRCIERMLRCLGWVLEDSRTRGRVASEVAAPLLAFFDQFADGAHQRKEEAVLFPRLLELAKVPEKVCLAKLMGEHEGERRLLRSLRANLFGAIVGVPACVLGFLESGRRYHDLYAQHVAKEDSLLFALAGRILTPASDLIILDGFQRIEAETGIYNHVVFDRVEEFCAGLGLGEIPNARGTTGSVGV